MTRYFLARNCFGIGDFMPYGIASFEVGKDNKHIVNVQLYKPTLHIIIAIGVFYIPCFVTLATIKLTAVIPANVPLK